MTVKRVLATTVGAVAVAVAVLVAPTLGADREPDIVRVSALTQPQVPADRIDPSVVRRSSFLAGAGIIVDAARFATERHGYRYYIAPNFDRQLCLFGVSSGEPEVGGICADPSTLRDSAIVLGKPDSRAKRIDVLGIVPDHVVAVDAGRGDVPVRGNVFAITAKGTRSPNLTLVTQEGSSRSVRLRTAR
jgi:hypothetical protein